MTTTTDRSEDYLRDGNRQLADELGVDYRPLADPWSERKRLLDLEIKLWNKAMEAWCTDKNIHFTWEIDEHQWTQGSVPWVIGPLR